MGWPRWGRGGGLGVNSKQGGCLRAPAWPSRRPENETRHAASAILRSCEMRPAASKLSRRRPHGYTTSTSRIISRGLTVPTDFAVTFKEYVDLSDGSAVVPNKVVKTPENEAKHAAWSEIHKPAKKYRIQYLNRTLSQEDFEELEAMGFVWFRSEWIWEQQIVPGLVAYKVVQRVLW